MKTFKYITVLTFSLLLFACSNDDDNTPDIVNEEELITTMTVNLVPSTGGTTVVLSSQDLDGDGPNAPIITVSGDLTAGTIYNGAITLLNETESPAENITLEVVEEAEEHQFFYVIGSALDVSTTYSNFDADNNPLGTEFQLTTNTASSGDITFILRHEPTKPNGGDPAVAGGETDISATFTLTVQ